MESSSAPCFPSNPPPHVLLQPPARLTPGLRLHPQDFEVDVGWSMASELPKWCICVVIDWWITRRAVNYRKCCFGVHIQAPTIKYSESMRACLRQTNTAADDLQLFRTTNRFEDTDLPLYCVLLACVRCFSAPEMLIHHHPRAWTYNLWTLRLGRDLTELPAEWETSWLHTTAQSIRQAACEDKGKTQIPFLQIPVETSN